MTILEKFNINDYIYFFPNNETRKAVATFYRDLYKKQYVEEEIAALYERITVEIDGTKLFRMQMHEFMLMFGSCMYMGSRPVIKDNNLFFDPKDIEPTKATDEKNTASA
jgi:hypothetical protein